MDTSVMVVQGPNRFADELAFQLTVEKELEDDAVSRRPPKAEDAEG